ncbi:hypothetical protein [Aquimarina algiphila]|uniref:hypothetical protein n=1 Tax=Aquimarina algiphila TaxID=2047982 RepID=UPI00232C7AF7|nr:hypothetical protein [Aquimarina algiphila]
MKQDNIANTLINLSNKEINLYQKVKKLYVAPTSFNNQFILNNIYIQYQDIHAEYVVLANKSIEALKRAVFLQWYAVTEPSYLTGISRLNKNAKQKSIIELKKQIKTVPEKELRYMLNYYLLWDYVFTSLTKSDVNQVSIPNMNTNNRGQMGIYWNSILKQKII